MAITVTQKNVQMATAVRPAAGQAFISNELTIPGDTSRVLEKALQGDYESQKVLGPEPVNIDASMPSSRFEAVAFDAAAQMRDLGIKLTTEGDARPSDGELLEKAYYEKAVERGLL